MRRMNMFSITLLLTIYSTITLTLAASNPSPAHEAVGVPVNTVLSWTEDTTVYYYKVYFGTDSTPDSGEYTGNQNETTYDPGTMAYNTTYYWRIDELTDSGMITGTVWSFTTGLTGPTVARWTMDDNDPTSVAVLNSSTGYHGTFVDSTNPYTSYHYNADRWEGSGSLNFDGINDYVEVPGYKGIIGNASRTCTAWVKTSSAQTGCILFWGTIDTEGQSWIFRVEWSGELSAGATGGLIKTTATVNDGQWHHVAAVLNNDSSPTINEIRLYIDGQLQSTTAVNGTIVINTVASQDVMIGAYMPTGTTSSHFLGLLDDVRIYDYALSSDEISLIHAWNPVPGDLKASVNSLLRWPDSVSALSYDIYLGTNPNDVVNAQPLLGDIDRNGPVDILDLSILASQWLVNGSADIVEDGIVNIDDFAALGATWGLDTPFKGNQAGTSYDPGTLVGDTTYYWRIDEVNAYGTTTGTVWSFTTRTALPEKAYAPTPANGAAQTWIKSDLSWSAGPNATSHDVYFGTDSIPDASEFKGNQTETTYDPGTLAYDTTYYWRIDEVNNLGTTTGTVWSFTTSSPRLAPEDFAIQAWASFSYSNFDAETFIGIYECGFNLGGRVQPAKLDMVAAAGLKAHIEDNDFWATPNHGLWIPKSEKDAIAQYYADLVGDHPGLFGYFLQDEPSVDTFSGIGEWVDSFHTADPDKQAYVNLGWNYDWASYISIVQNDFMSYDWYGIREDSSGNEYYDPQYFPCLEKARLYATNNSLPFWNTVSSIQLDYTPYPSPANLRFQAFTSLAYGVRGISWFHYHPFEDTWPAPIAADGSKTDIWYMLQDVNLHLHRIGPVYITLNYVNVFHWPNVPSGTTWIPYGSRGISSSYYVNSLSGGDFCVGEFTDPSGHPYIMLVNKSMENTSNFNVSFKTGGTMYRVNSNTGQLETLEADERYLAPGEGMLITVQ